MNFDYQHTNAEEYRSCLVGYNADTNTYRLVDICYEMCLGTFHYSEDMGTWEFHNEASFHENVTLSTVLEFLTDLNSTINQ